MRRGGTPRLVAAGVLLLHLPYLRWLVEVGQAAPLAALRAAAALLAALVFLLRSGEAPRRAVPRPTLAVACWVAAGGLLLVGALRSPLWAPWGTLLLVVGLGLGRGGRAGLGPVSLPALLVVIAFPWELFSGGLDYALQLATAACALPLLWLTGLPVRLSAAAAPTLVAAHLRVHVTALCAGSETFLALATLGLVVAAAALPPGRGRWIFVALTPLIGFAGNVLRVALSTHAARLWAADPGAWQVAHDVIGYAAFAATYGVLFILARRWRRLSAPPANAARPSR